MRQLKPKSIFSGFQSYIYCNFTLGNSNLRQHEPPTTCISKLSSFHHQQFSVYNGTPLIQPPVGKKMAVLMGWMYYWGSVKFHELRVVMTNITYIAFALVELFSSINNWNIDIMYCNCIHYLKLSFSKAQKPFKIRLLNHHRRLLSVMSSKNNTRTGSAY